MTPARDSTVEVIFLTQDWQVIPVMWTVQQSEMTRPVNFSATAVMASATSWQLITSGAYRTLASFSSRLTVMSVTPGLSLI